MEKERVREVSWKADEYNFYAKSPDWYWVLGIIILVLLVVAYMTSNPLLGFLIIIGGFSVVVFATRKPAKINVSISGQGVQINDRLYTFDALQSFWIFYRPGGTQELSIRSKKMFMSFIKVPLGDADPNEIREFLIEYMPEKAQQESFVDTLSNLLRF